MNKKKKNILLLAILILLFFSLNYNFLDSSLTNFFEERENIFVSRVIDGDTVKWGNKSIRLLGINTPEKGEAYSNDAKEFLENLVINKSVRLEYGEEKFDKYHRVLGHLYVDSENVNLKLVENGFANPYFPVGKQKYYHEFWEAWEKCTQNNMNLCEKSIDICSECIKLEEFDYKNQKITLINRCDENCDLSGFEIKDEGRKKFVFEEFILEKAGKVEIVVGEGIDTKEKLFWKNEDYVWTKTGDSLFFYDDKNKLVLWENY